MSVPPPTISPVPEVALTLAGIIVEIVLGSTMGSTFQSAPPSVNCPALLRDYRQVYTNRARCEDHVSVLIEALNECRNLQRTP